MAVYRKIHVTFWEDPDMEDMTPEGRYFYLCLLTNPRTNQSGIYEISIKKLCEYSGYNRETVSNLLNRFSEIGKIYYSLETRELALKNWPRYNMSKSDSVITNVLKNMELVKNRDLVKWVYGGSDKWNKKSLLAWYEQGMHRVPTECQQKEKEKEEEEEEEKKEKERGKSVPRFEPVDLKLSGLLFDHVSTKRTIEQMKRVNLKKWADTFRLMRERDGFTVEQLEQVIRFLPKAPVENNGFCWGDVILSAENMRKHLNGHLAAAVFRKRKPDQKTVGRNDFKGPDLEQDPAYLKLMEEQAETHV